MESRYQYIADIYHIMRKEFMIAYRGEFDSKVLSVIVDNIHFQVDDPGISKKLFKIFIELAQNISYYSAEQASTDKKDSGIGIFMLKQHPDTYELFTGNMVLNEKTDHLASKCDIINSLDREGLRKYKREQRNKDSLGTHQGANIGLIQVALISGYPLEYLFIPIDDEKSFYSLSLKVAKSEVDDTNI